VSDTRVGDRIWVYQAQYSRRFGTAAEYVAIDAARAPVLPNGVGFEVGACLGIPAMTAHRCVFADGDVAGQTVLVTGGAGRVGHYAIQWASQAGARVIATASNSEDADACRSAGAQDVVDHSKDSFAEAVLDVVSNDRVDRVVDVEFGANLPVSLRVLRVGGTIATYSSTQVPEPALPFFRMMYQDLTVRFVIVYAMPESAKAAAIKDITRALEEERLEHRIARTLPLEDIAEANELIEQGRLRGSLILDNN
jgi:NADPH2:quinone reductase